MLLAMILALGQTVEGTGKCESGTPDAPWFTRADYPAASLQAGEEGEVRFRLDIDVEGCVTGCTVIASSGHKALDDGTCALLMRTARFKAARTPEGKPYASHYENRFRWFLPDPLEAGSIQPEPVVPLGAWFADADYPSASLRAEEQGDVVFRVSIDETGAVTGCEVRVSSGFPALDISTCSVMSARGRFRPARDPRGRPIPSRWSSMVRWRLPN